MPSHKHSTALLLAALLLLATTAAQATRPIPATILEQKKEAKTDNLERICEGLGDDEQCLMRRTLEAHIDYIYTEQKNP
ncbi:hypothetical protein HPP92_007708 [Vanilla planifolia]|uniref:Phytosulfokine n=1 Tax=Vanilla planifolia TaxID=51239 RepID=A0A835RMY7_VANPL|nr:hypothetical protein HPP92_007708 [Vanilla planifolia]